MLGVEAGLSLKATAAVFSGGRSNLDSRVEPFQSDTLRVADVEVVPNLRLPVKGPVHQHTLCKPEASQGPGGPISALPAGFGGPPGPARRANSKI